MGFMTGKRALIVGVASERSIAWGIAKAMHREGARLALTYQTEKLKSRVDKCAAMVDSDLVLPRALRCFRAKRRAGRLLPRCGDAGGVPHRT